MLVLSGGRRAVPLSYVIFSQKQKKTFEFNLVCFQISYEYFYNKWHFKWFDLIKRRRITRVHTHTKKTPKTSHINYVIS